jgi:hypothetical protein
VDGSASFGLECGAHGAMCMVESRADRPRRDAEHLGDLRRGVSHEVMQDKDRPLVRREPPEAAIQLVSIGDAEEVVRCRRSLERKDSEVGRVTALARRLRDADVGQETMDPGVEPVRIAEATKVTPGDHQRVLHGILGPIDIPEDPLCDREEAIAARTHQVDECRLVAALRCLDEVAIHRPDPVSTPIGDVGHLYRYIVDAKRWNNGLGGRFA